MAREPTGNPVGAPEKPINWELFEQLCGLQCTESEMASMLKVVDSLGSPFFITMGRIIRPYIKGSRRRDYVRLGAINS